MSFSYSKSEKLKSKKIIGELFSSGKSISAYPLLLIYLKNNTKLQTGVSVSKKRFKNATDRNRIKRLLREGYRLNKSVLIDNKIDNYSFIILYVGKDMPDFKLINSKVKALFSKFITTQTNSKQYEK